MATVYGATMAYQWTWYVSQVERCGNQCSGPPLGTHMSLMVRQMNMAQCLGDVMGAAVGSVIAPMADSSNGWEDGTQCAWRLEALTALTYLVMFVVGREQGRCAMC